MPDNKPNTTGVRIRNMARRVLSLLSTFAAARGLSVVSDNGAIIKEYGSGPEVCEIIDESLAAAFNLLEPDVFATFERKRMFPVRKYGTTNDATTVTTPQTLNVQLGQIVVAQMSPRIEKACREWRAQVVADLESRLSETSLALANEQIRSFADRGWDRPEESDLSVCQKEIISRLAYTLESIGIYRPYGPDRWSVVKRIAVQAFYSSWSDTPAPELTYNESHRRLRNYWSTLQSAVGDIPDEACAGIENNPHWRNEIEFLTSKIIAIGETAWKDAAMELNEIREDLGEGLRRPRPASEAIGQSSTPHQ